MGRGGPTTPLAWFGALLAELPAARFAKVRLGHIWEPTSSGARHTAKRSARSDFRPCEPARAVSTWIGGKTPYQCARRFSRMASTLRRPRGQSRDRRARSRSFRRALGTQVRRRPPRARPLCPPRPTLIFVVAARAQAYQDQSAVAWRRRKAGRGSSDELRRVFRRRARRSDSPL